MGIIQFIKELAGAKESESEHDTWSEAKDSVTVKKAEYESMQRELFNQTEIIKRLRRENDQSRSIASEYEAAFDIFTQHGNGAEEVLARNRTALIELERVRSSEERLKTHVQALKRELLISEERVEEAVALKQLEVEGLRDEVERLSSEVKGKNQKINELSYAVSEMKIELAKREEKVVELVAISRELLKEYR